MKFIFYIIMFLLGTCVVSADIRIVVGDSVKDKIDNSFIKRIYTGKELVAYNLSDNKSLVNDFYSLYVGRSFSEINKEWARIVFTGAGESPKELKTDQDVIEFIKKNPNSIGYINAASATSDLKILKIE